MKLPKLPRSVQVALSILVVALIGFILTQLFLVSRVEALRAENQSLNSQLRQIRADSQRLRTDSEFVQTELERYERVLSSDLLIPHTRRSVLRVIEEYALSSGLTQLDYEFTSVDTTRSDSISRQVAESEYRVNVETINLTAGALLDRPLFLFVEEVLSDLPGSAILQSLEVSREETLSTDLLNRIAADPTTDVVNANIVFQWRTAQAKE